MNDLRRRRLRAPGLTAGVGLALAVGVLAAAGWAAALSVAAIAAVSAALYYWLGGTETDVGALLASRADERQVAVRLWVRAFAAVALLPAAAIGAVVSAALHRPAWPYAAIAALGAACFLAGLAYYRRRGGLGDSGVRLRAGARLDERQAAVAIHALQLAGVAMFLVATTGGLALSSRPADADPLRILAVAFAAALAAGFALFRPRRGGRA